MGLPSESPVVIGLRSRDGIALVAAIFGIVVIGLITAGAFALTDLDTKATYNREDAATALRLAHTAEAHALSLFRTQLNDTSVNRLLRGADNTANTTDDGLFVDFPGLGASIDIPDAGRAGQGGTYTAQILDDPNDGDGNAFNDTNWRFVVRCAGETARGSRSVIEFVVKYLPPVPAIAFNGNVVLQGNPTANGTCGDIHANGNVSVSGTITVNRLLTTSGTPSGSGNVVNASAISIGVLPVPEQIPIPTMTAAEYCPSADYVLNADGTALNRATGITTTGLLGWARSVSGGIVTWTASATMLPASYCAMANVIISGNPGPIAVSVFSTGSIEISGNPKLSPAHPSSVLLLADGDLYVRGNGSTTYNGILYGGSNCRASGSLNLTGQYLCQSGPAPAGHREIVASNLIEGNPIFNYSCTWAVPNDKYRITSWYQRIGI